MDLVVSLDAFFDFVKGQLSKARSQDDVEYIMENAKDFMIKCYAFKED